jgi:AcrR family transcriptional regulator
MTAAAGENTRERLVMAAQELFLLQGYHATGIAQILKKAGVNSGSLYYYFPTKEDLLIAVLEHYHANIEPGLLDYVWPGVNDPIERVFALLDGYRQMLLMMEFNQGCPIGNLALELANSHPRARELMVANFDQWVEKVRDCFDEARDRLPSDLDRGALAMHVLTVMEGAVMLARSYRSLEPFDAAVQQLRDYIERLIADGSAWSAPRTT